MYTNTTIKMNDYKPNHKTMDDMTEATASVAFDEDVPIQESRPLSSLCSMVKKDLQADEPDKNKASKKGWGRRLLKTGKSGSSKKQNIEESSARRRLPKGGLGSSTRTQLVSDHSDISDLMAEYEKIVD